MLETVQLNFFKRLLRLPINTANYLVRLECGISRLSLLVLKMVLNWLQKVSHMEDSRYPKICLNRLFTLHFNFISNTAKFNWFSQVVNFLRDADENLTITSLNSIIENKATLLAGFKSKLYFMDYSECLSSSHFPLYKTLFFDDKHAEYLNLNLPIQYSRTMAQLRLSSRETLVLTHKFNSYIINQRAICSICNTNELESLEHLLFSCPVYNGLRSHFETLIGTEIGSISQLLSSVNNIRIISNYLFSVLKIRSFIINE